EAQGDPEAARSHGWAASAGPPRVAAPARLGWARAEAAAGHGAAAREILRPLLARERAVAERADALALASRLAREAGDVDDARALELDLYYTYPLHEASLALAECPE